MTPCATLILAGYTLPDREAIQRIVAQAPYLTKALIELALALDRYFPHAPLVLHADGAGLYLCIGVGDVERALAGPLAAFDGEWWQQQPVRVRCRLTIDVECKRHGR